MKCPHCNKEIFAMTGLQEIQKFMKHLPKCKKRTEVELWYTFNKDYEGTQWSTHKLYITPRIGFQYRWW